MTVPDLGTGKLGSCLGRHQKRGVKIKKRGGAKRIKGAPKTSKGRRKNYRGAQKIKEVLIVS